MKKLTYIVCILITIFFHSNTKADTNDSCVGGMTLLVELINDLTSLGMFSSYSTAFNMTDSEGTNCSVPSNNVTFSFDTYDSATASYPTINYNWTAGDNFANVSTPQGILATAQAAHVGDQICVQFYNIISGWQTIGCKYRPDSSSSNYSPSCFSGQSCLGGGSLNSQAQIPITSQVVQCVTESLQAIFVDQQSACPNSSETMLNLFPQFQNSMRNAVRAALTLYAVIFGMKVALGGGEILRKGDVFKALMTFILVLYFSVGGVPTFDATTGQTVYSDGVTQYLIPMANYLPAAFADLVYNSVGNQSICYFNPDNYASPKYGYLSMWDSIDCRIIQYFGFDFQQVGTELLIVGSGFFNLILYAFFAFDIFFMIMSIIFGLFFLSVTIFFTHIYLIATVALAILVYMAPLFVPFALFPQTKSYFNKWVHLVMSYILYPMIVSAFMAMMLTTFDTAMYGTCTFSSESITLGSRTTTSYSIELPDSSTEACQNYSSTESCQQACKDSWGYLFGGYAGNTYNSVSVIFFDVLMLKSGVASDLFNGLLVLALFSVLYYQFVQTLADFASDITGAPSMAGMAAKPTQLFDKTIGTATHLAKAAAKYYTGDKKGAAKEAGKAAGTAIGGETGAKISKAADQIPSTDDKGPKSGSVSTSKKPPSMDKSKDQTDKGNETKKEENKEAQKTTGNQGGSVSSSQGNKPPSFLKDIQDGGSKLKPPKSD